jgi:hypothetical protein
MSRKALVLLAALALHIGASPALTAPQSDEPQIVAVPTGRGAAKTGAAEARRAESVRLKLDDGTAETVIGLTLRDDPTKGLQAVVLNRFTPSEQALPFTLETAMILFPKTCQVGDTGLRRGMTFDLVVYVDPTGSGDPDNAQLALRQSFELRPSDRKLQKIPLTTPVTIQSGDIWVGYTNSATATNPTAIYHAALDTTTSRGRSWIFYNGSGGNFTGDLLSNAQFQRRTDDAGVPGNWIIRIRGQAG